MVYMHVTQTSYIVERHSLKKRGNRSLFDKSMKFGTHVENHKTNKSGYRGASNLTFGDLYVLIKVCNMLVILSYSVPLIKFIHVWYQMKAPFVRSNMKFELHFNVNLISSYSCFCTLCD